MRLLEPINGVKFAQGNFMQHIVFFIAMFTMSRDVDKNFQPHAKDLVLNSSSGHEEALSDQEIKEFELHIFKVLQWGHLFCFVFQIASFYLKAKGYFNMA